MNIPMTQITARVPEKLTRALDEAARGLNRPRAEIVRRALERYLQDFRDLSDAAERMRDPDDPVLDWDDVRQDLLAED